MKVIEREPPEARFPVSHAPTEVAVCVDPSRFVHVTVSPACTAIVPG